MASATVRISSGIPSRRMDATETNRAHWEALARVHAAQNTGYYDADALIAGRDTVPDRWLGDVSGMDVMHLQCHLAYDAISLARRGARVRGAAGALYAARPPMNLYVESSGSGPAVLFLHGVAGSSRTYSWLELEGRTNVRFDFRGHGASDRAPGRYLIQDYVDDAISVLESVGPAVLAGHSLGGVTAWTVAQQRPELVRSLFLEDPPLFMGEPEEHADNPGIPAFVLMRENTARWQAAGATPAEVAAELTAQVLPDGRTMEEFQTDEARAARGYALTHLDLEVLDRVIDGTLLTGTDTTSPVGAPTFILAADDAIGAAFPSAHEARLAQTHPDVEVVRLPGASHTIHDERAFRDEYVRRLSSRA